MKKRLGGIDFAALERQAKADKAKAAKKASNEPEKAVRSKIHTALNPQVLWKQTAAEKREAADDDNVMVLPELNISGHDQAQVPRQVATPMGQQSAYNQPKISL